MSKGSSGWLRLAALSITMLALAASAQAADNKKVVVAKAGNFLAWGLIDIAKAKGYFAQHGLDVEILQAQGGPQVLAAVLAGRADFSTTSLCP